MTYRLSELAALLMGRVIGDDLEIHGVSTLTDACPGDLAFLDNPRQIASAERSQASALLVPPDVTVPGKSHIEVVNPRLAFARGLSLFHPPNGGAASVHGTAEIAPDADVSPSATIMAHVVVGPRTIVGPGAILHPFTCLGEGVAIGEGTELFPGVVVYDRVSIGMNVRIHAGTVIGSDGFGYEREGRRHIKVPHIGTVVIEDDVEIGANCAIDRAKVGATRVGRGSKIDNLVQIGHNVQIGENCIIVAQVGLCGSVRFEDNVMAGGQAAVSEHRSIGEGSRLGARAGVIHDVPPRSVYSGFPARPHVQWLRAKAAAERLPAMIPRIRELEDRIGQLERVIEELKENRSRGDGG